MRHNKRVKAAWGPMIQVSPPALCLQPDIDERVH